MAHRTTFAGLAAPDVGDSPSQVLNGDFLYQNPDLTAQFLKIGAVSHRHDAHLALQDPVAPPALASATGGGLQSGLTLYFTYTLTDAQGGETLPAAPAFIFTGDSIDVPGNPNGTPDYAAGIMPAGSYAYALTYTDGQGGETTLGPTTWVYVNPGFASAQVDFAGLSTGLISGGSGGTATTWRLWRSDEGADWHLVTESDTDTFIDAGFDPPDNPAVPPVTNTTAGGATAVVVTIPTPSVEPAIASAVSVNIYMDQFGMFASPALLTTIAAGSGGQALTVISTATLPGGAPAVSTSIPGAALIDPDTDMLDYPWKRPVATHMALGSGEYGDTRPVLDTGFLYTVTNPAGATGPSDWTTADGGGGGGGGGGTDVTIEGGAVLGSLDIVDTGAITLTLTDLGGGSGRVAIGLTEEGLTSFQASAANASGEVTTSIAFAGSGVATVNYDDLGGGSGLVTVTVPPVAGPPGPTGPTGSGGAPGAAGASGATGAMGTTGATGATGTPGSTGPAGPSGPGGSAFITVEDGTHKVNPLTDIKFVATGAAAVLVTDLGGGSAQVSIGATGGGGGTSTLAVSDGTNIVNPAAEVTFSASGNATVGVAAVGGGSATVTMYSKPTPCFTVDDVFGGSAMAGGLSAVPVEFLGSGAASATVSSVGGSAVVTITVPTIAGATGATGAAGGAGPTGATGATGAPGPAASIGVDDGLHLVAPITDVRFQASGAASVGVSSLGGGSALVTISSPVGQVPVIAASGGASAINPDYYTEYAASGGATISIQAMGGGSARVLLGLSNTAPATTQASGYTFGQADIGAVVESASAATSVGYIVPLHATTPLPLGGIIEVFQYGTGQIQIVGATAGVVLRSDGQKTKVAGQFGTIGLRQRALDEWVLSGDLA